MIGWDALVSLAATEAEPRQGLCNYFNSTGANREGAARRGRRNTAVGVTFDL